MSLMNNYEYDGRNLKIYEPKLSLHKSGLKFNRIGNIKDAINRRLTRKSKEVNELSFSIPYIVEMNNEVVRNHIVDIIKPRQVVKVKIADQEEMYIITKIEKSMQDDDYMNVQCFSLPYELKFQKMIDYVAKSYNLLMVMEDCLKDTRWKLGYINPDFNLLYKQFDVSSKTKLDFINEVCEAFKAEVKYDTVNRTISFYKEEELHVYKNFWLKYGKYLTGLSDSQDIEDVVTKLVVSANENASINSVNPTGQNYILDFTYYLAPFERDNNRVVIQSSAHMDDDLAHAILDYNALLNKHENDFSLLLSSKQSYREKKTQLENEMQVLSDELDILIDLITARIETKSGLEDLEYERDMKKAQLDAKKLEITSVDNDIAELDAGMSALNELLKIENNITGDLYEKLKDYIFVEEYTDENALTDEDLFYSAAAELKKKSVPPINLSVNIINFFEILEERHNWDRLEVGDIIRVKHEALDIDVKTTVTEMTFDYDGGNIDLIVANTKRPKNEIEEIADDLYTIRKVNEDITKRKITYNTIATNFDKSNDRIKTTPNPVKNITVKHKDNGNGSVDLTVSWDYNKYEDTKKDADNIDGFIIHRYGSTTNEKFIFPNTNSDKVSIQSVMADKRTYTFPSSPANNYYTIGIRAYRTVDKDINSEGYIFSDLITPKVYPYQPMKGLIIGGIPTTDITVLNKDGKVPLTNLTPASTTSPGIVKVVNTPSNVNVLADDSTLAATPNYVDQSLRNFKNGNIDFPNNSRVFVTLGGSQTIKHSVTTKVTFGNEYTDTQNEFANNAFTPKESGVYLIVSYSLFSDVPAGDVYHDIWENGSQLTHVGVGYNKKVSTYSRILYLTAGRKYEFYIQMYNGGNDNNLAAAQWQLCRLG